ncbi:Ape1p [Sugiyamaella lignohabitans]|uniref:Ape1p n=1 Tax=Sugiyamaella lignohabitans TaxID=796027 RepID=A0A167C1H9_9ASCO|nr:Ape1p [Sugiyamaella lignohabitans]ANB11102.1 Ape1p [Sugiyamaella lignohabitans]
MTSFRANPAFKNARQRKASSPESFEIVDSVSTNGNGSSESEKATIRGEFDPKLSSTQYTDLFLDFMNTSPTTYHAVNSVAEVLEAQGFVYLSERESWEDKITKSNRFYTTRNGSSLLAFVVGKDWAPGKGAAIIGSHIDALTGKVKPISKKTPVEGYEQIGTAPYSGAFNSTWWDRDLGIGGRIITRSKDTKKIESKLVRIPYPVARIPTLAPHFGAVASGPFNPETQMTPIIGLIGDEDPELVATADEKRSPLIGKHSLRLLRALSKHSGIPVGDFLQLDLEVYDTHPGTVGGLDKEFVFCPRIDDKLCSFAAVYGLLESLEKVDDNSSLSFVALYDDEEIGSLLRQGAESNLLEGTIDRLLALHGSSDEELKRLTYANSFLISADVIHAVNPNFDNVYLEHHKPKLNVGVTVSFDPNGHMTTDAVSTAFVEEIARRTDNVLQAFQIRNDSRSGGTIGPKLSSKTGLRAIDMGIPQLSMHSIRATTGSKDVYLGVKFFKAFFEKWEEVDVLFKLGDL